jgi:hypothetical protein
MSITFSDLGKSGRLGNAMFQIAATVALALRNNDTYQFPNTWPYKDNFNISKECFVSKINITNNYAEPSFIYNDITYSPNLNLSGYFQSYRYIELHKEEIKKLLTPNIKVNKQNYTSLHIRRTDYLTHKNCYNILTLANYYSKAMAASGGSKFLIFSDEMGWAKQNFTGNEFDFAEGNDAITDLNLMLNCSGGNIIANSSFSWWGAWLNANEHKQVIYPRVWFGPELAKVNDIKDLCPIDWIRI